MTRIGIWTLMKNSGADLNFCAHSRAGESKSPYQCTSAQCLCPLDWSSASQSWYMHGNGVTTNNDTERERERDERREQTNK